MPGLHFVIIVHGLKEDYDQNVVGCNRIPTQDKHFIMRVDVRYRKDVNVDTISLSHISKEIRRLVLVISSFV